MAKAKSKAQPLQKIIFVKSPTGKYGLSYSAGDTYESDDIDLVAEMIDTGFAKLAD